MDELHRWLEAQFAERKVEPNSGLQEDKQVHWVDGEGTKAKF